MQNKPNVQFFVMGWAATRLFALAFSPMLVLTLCSASADCTPPSQPSQWDIIRRQQAAALWQNSTASSSTNYGAVSSIIERIEAALNNAQHVLSNPDYYDFQSRLYTLKQNASLELSRGADASSFVQPAQSLETEIRNKIAESAQSSGSKKTHLESSLTRLELLIGLKTDQLGAEDANMFSDKLSELKTRFRNLATSDEIGIEKLNDEIRELEAKIMDRAMFGRKQNKLIYSREEEKSPEQTSSKAPAVTPAPVQTPAPAVQGQTIRAAKKPLVPIPKLIEQIENELIAYHEKHQIGSFDMDSYTEKLLVLKKNLHVMMSKTGRVSARQEAHIREEIERLHNDITDRVIGKQ